jgi:hypothetical protein
VKSDDEKYAWKKLRDPVHESNIEWRVQDSGKGAKGVWARVVCYLTVRAIENILDDVVGPENWSNEYREWHVGDKHGVLCGISIRIGDQWVTKWDGAENTAIDGLKGGLSGSMKRAAVKWGIGRYLYRLDAYYAQVFETRTKDANYAKTKDGTVFFWLPPALPVWAGGGPQPQPEPEPEPQPQHKSGPGDDVAASAKALASVLHAPTEAALDRIMSAVCLRIEKGLFNSVEAEQLEKAIDARRAMLQKAHQRKVNA